MFCVLGIRGLGVTVRRLVFLEVRFRRVYWGLGFRIQCFGFCVLVLGLWVWGRGFGFEGF